MRDDQYTLKSWLQAVRREHRFPTCLRTPPKNYAPGDFVHEIEVLAEAGMSNSQAIAAGTSVAAESIGLDDVAGRLEPGRPADILVVDGDPQLDLKASLL